MAADPSYRRAERTASAEAAARAALEARRMASSIAADRERQGLVLASFRADAEATESAAEARTIVASLEARIARAELARVVGDTQWKQSPVAITGGF